MSTAERTSQSGQREAEEWSVIHQSAQALTELIDRISVRVRRAEVRRRLGQYVRGLLTGVERKNGWQMAEELGDRDAHGVQRRLAEADWDEEAVRDDLRAYVIEHLGEPGGTLVADETGFLKKGRKSAGVARQDSGTAGRRENSQIGVFLSYVSTKGAAFIDRMLDLPNEWTQDRVRCREAGIGDDVAFATKGEQARQMLARAFAAGVPAEWVVADSVDGYEDLRLWLEARHKSYVLAVPETHQIWVQGHLQSVGLLAALLPEEAWTVLSAGEGCKGPRLYEWAWLQVPEEREQTDAPTRWVLIRRSLADRSARASYRVAGPASLTLTEVVQRAGCRWRIEEGYEQAKGAVGLDQYEVRTWRAWYRYITLALVAYAALVVMRAQASAQEKKPVHPACGCP